MIALVIYGNSFGLIPKENMDKIEKIIAYILAFIFIFVFIILSSKLWYCDILRTNALFC